MKVILLRDVPNLGREGDVKEVPTGYARNYLLPRGWVAPATPGALKALEAERRARGERMARQTEKASELAARLAETTLTFQAKAGPTGRLYGSITTADIAKALSEQLGVPIDRRDIMCEPLRQVGPHTVPIRISHDLVAQVQVVLTAE